LFSFSASAYSGPQQNPSTHREPHGVAPFRPTRSCLEWTRSGQSIANQPFKIGFVANLNKIAFSLPTSFHSQRSTRSFALLNFLSLMLIVSAERDIQG